MTDLFLLHEAHKRRIALHLKILQNSVSFLHPTQKLLHLKVKNVNIKVSFDPLTIHRCQMRAGDRNGTLVSNDSGTRRGSRDVTVALTQASQKLLILFLSNNETSIKNFTHTSSAEDSTINQGTDMCLALFTNTRGIYILSERSKFSWIPFGAKFDEIRFAATAKVVEAVVGRRDQGT